MKLEDIVKKNFSLGDPLAEYLIKDIRKWAKGIIPKKIERNISCYSASNRRGRESAVRQMLRNIEEA